MTSFTSHDYKTGDLILGINAFGHDNSACLVDAATGSVLYACPEERLTNIKHDWHFPVGMIQRCREIASRMNGSITDVAVSFDAVDFVAGTLASEIRRIVGDPDKALELNSQISSLFEYADYYDLRGYSFSGEVIDRAIERAKLSAKQKEEIAKRVSWYFNWGVKYKHVGEIVKGLFPDTRIHFVNHHLAHAASAFFNSGYDQATVLVIDGQGESDTVSVFRGDKEGLHPISRSGWPHSLGIFYLSATEHLGFKLGDEYKVMGMSAYGTPVYYPILRKMMSVNAKAELIIHETEFLELVDLSPKTGHFGFSFTRKFASEILPPHRKDTPFLQKHFDFAASIQKLAEDVGVEIARNAVAMTGLGKIAVAGGVGLNGLMNERIRCSDFCDDIFIYPAAADDGTSVGAAQLVAFSRSRFAPKRVYSVYYGYEPNDAEIVQALEMKGLRYTRPESIHKQIAQSLQQGKIVARYTGRSEFGPRALGHRSILADPFDPKMKDTLNLRIKHREEFRPFAPACRRERVEEYFDINVDAPFMLLIGTAKEAARRDAPAIVHADGTARVQTVSSEHNADFCRILLAFEELTGRGVLVNTSFNVNGETIVDTPLDAVESFGFMDIDYLAIGEYWVAKSENSEKFPSLKHDDYLDIRRARFRERNLGPLAELDISRFNACFYRNILDIAETLVKRTLFGKKR